VAMEDNKALVLQFYRGFDDRRIEDSMNLLAPVLEQLMVRLSARSTTEHNDGN
jgi:hypothetical protein